MKKIQHPLARRLTAGAECCLIASILWPFALFSRLLYALGAAVFFWACCGAKNLRGEFSAARKHLATFGVLLGTCAFLQEAPVSRLLALGGAVFGYFSIALLCAGCQALQERCEENERPSRLPSEVGRFEVCAGLFALCQIVALSAPGLCSLADLAAMVCFTVGFVSCSRYFAQWAPADGQ